MMKFLHNKQEFSPEMMSEEVVEGMIQETYRILHEAMDRGIADNVLPPAMEAKLERSLFLFSGFKTAQELREASQLLRVEDGTLKPFSTFLKDVQRIDQDYNVHYLEAEYNFAVSSAQMAAKWADITEDEGRYDLQYRTMGDDHVREEHQALNGITLPADDPFWQSYFPPNGWNCRCTTVQVLREKYPRSDPDQAKAAGEEATSQPKQKIFRFNPGLSQQLFPDHHPYYKTSLEVREAVLNLAAKTDEEKLKQDEKIQQWINYFERADKNIAPELTSLQKAVIAEYTGSGFWDLNRMLGEYDSHNIDQDREYLKSYARILEEALKAKNSKFSGTVYRISKMPTQVLDIYKTCFENNQPITIKTFLSTSYDPEAIVNFSNDSNVRYQIKSRNGVKIEDLSEFRHEMEVLFVPSSRFRITDFKEENGQFFVTMEEL